MLRRFAAPVFLAALLLTACTWQAQALPAASPLPEATAAPEQTPPPSAQSTPAAPAGLTPAGPAVLEYDEIRPLLHDGISPFRLNTDYYTMRQGDRWGLLRTDGTEVLPCDFSAPFYQCEMTDTLRWHTEWPDSPSDRAFSDWSARLASGGDGILCDGHGGTCDLFIYDADVDRVRHLSTLDGSTREWIDFAPYTAVYGSWLPCYRGHFADDGGEWDWWLDRPRAMAYYNADAAPLNGQAYDNAGFFFDQLLAPVEQNGKWAYIDQNGVQMTGTVYSATCGIANKDDLGFTDESVGTTPAFASPLLNGYAAVCRDGRYGLLDSRGREYVPCQYDGAVWDGGALWLQQKGAWRQYAIPGVSKPASTSPPPDAPVMQPDRLPAQGERTAYTTTWQDNLKVRTGPGTEYQEIDKLAPGTPVEKLGSCQGIANWMLVRYGSRQGWVCSDYLH